MYSSVATYTGSATYAEFSTYTRCAKYARFERLLNDISRFPGREIKMPQK